MPVPPSPQARTGAGRGRALPGAPPPAADLGDRVAGPAGLEQHLQFELSERNHSECHSEIGRFERASGMFPNVRDVHSSGMAG